MSSDFTTIRTVGGMLPPDLLGRMVAGDKDLGGLSPSDYDLPNETPREAANRVWSYLFGVWTAYKARLAALPEGDPAVGLTREKWLLVLFDQLGYGRLATTPPGGLHVADRAFPVSHRWGQVPLHLLGWGVELDKRTKGVAGAAERAPHAMAQELLNRTDDYLWAIVSNGQTLRLLRDSSSLSGQSYVEFDLASMFDGEVFSDFAVMFLLLHRSRVEILSPDGPASECWLERWRTASIESGTRALGQLRGGVQSAMELLGTGFLQHPANTDLRRRLAVKELSLQDYHRSLLRLVYRLLFLFVAEDRQALLIQDADRVAVARYADYFSTARLRALSRKRRGTRHGDLWESLSLVIASLGDEQGCPELGLPGIGGLFDHGPGDVITGQSLPNDALLAAIRYLSVVQPKGQPKRSVDYRNLGAEELGSIYESLLELVPRHDCADQTFTLESLAGNERKTTGSYYTPTSLIELVLDEALGPLLDDAEKSDNPAEALLALTICDPACGSGHFLVAAARLIADRLAVARTGDVDPTPTDQQAAMHDVVANCIYGVDLNPMAAELAKVSLWLEALQSGRPLTFLDAHIKVGNALLGTTPDLLAAGIPDAAYTPIQGDDRKHAAALKKRNRAERDRPGQGELFDIGGIDVSNGALRAKLRDALTAKVASLEDLHVAQRRYADYQNSPELHRARRLADAWCTAFVQPKVPNAPFITQSVLDGLDNRSQLFTLGESGLDAPATLGGAVDDLIQQTARQHRFFHWHVEFPEIFDVPTGAASTPRGWTGGFSAMLGNPPWETVQMSEKEFFASRAPHIANAANAAARKRMISALGESNPGLFAEFLAESRRSEAENLLVRASGRYPLCARGKINTYSIFAEHFRAVIAPAGRMGIVTPTGLATDATTAAFFADTLRSRRLAAFYDFENEAKIFEDVHHAFRFAVSCLTGGEPVDQARLAFVVRHIADVPTRRFSLAADEILLLNPNTGTLPLFRSRTDAEITIGIYRRHPVLIRGGEPSGNPWGLSFRQGLFNMASDSGLFRTANELADLGAKFDGWDWSMGTKRWLPLYEAKLLGHFDHRLATYKGATQAQLNVGSLPRITARQHDDPCIEPLARYWVDESEISASIGNRSDNDWLFGFRRLTRSSDARTFIPAVMPRTAVGDNTWIALVRSGPVAALQVTWSSLISDYLVRQKLSGTTLSAYIVEQLACPTPHVFESPTPWDQVTLETWLLPRLLELAYTSWRLAAYAFDVSRLHTGADPGSPFRWIPERREILRAELDSAMFHVYGLARPEVEHVLDSFFVVRKYEDRDHGEFRTKRLVLEIYDAMAEAEASGTAYRTVLDPPPGEGPRHPARQAP